MSVRPPARWLAVALAVVGGASRTVEARTFCSPAPFVDRFGASVAAVGPNVLIGAPGDAANPGAAYLFDATTGALIQKFQAPAPSADDAFGSSVSVVGADVLVGA